MRLARVFHRRYRSITIQDPFVNSASRETSSGFSAQADPISTEKDSCSTSEVYLFSGVSRAQTLPELAVYQQPELYLWKINSRRDGKIFDKIRRGIFTGTGIPVTTKPGSFSLSFSLSVCVYVDVFVCLSQTRTR